MLTKIIDGRREFRSDDQRQIVQRTQSQQTQQRAVEAERRQPAAATHIRSIRIAAAPKGTPEEGPRSRLLD